MVARDKEAETVAHRALSEIFRIYWKPIYAFVRRSGKSPHDAEDITQGVFEHFLATEIFSQADREKGRLRSFLLGAVKHYLLQDYRKSSAKKRGGHVTTVSIDFCDAESELADELSQSETPERVFERRWAHTVLETVLSDLRAEQEKRGKLEQFERLSVYLSIKEEHTPYAELSRETGMQEPAIRIAVYRIRKRYRELLYKHVAATVESQEQVDDEIAYLLEALR